MDDPLEKGSPTPVLCAVCSHEWIEAIEDKIVAVSIECPECGSTAGMVAD